MRLTALLAVALIAAALLSGDLGRAPFVDPSEGLHAEIAREMVRSGDWITPHLDGIPYFDKPPLLYWLMAASFAALGCSEWSACLWSTLPAIAVTVLTARIGMLLASVRVGLIAGLMVVANLEVFVFSGIVKPDLLFVSLILLALSAFMDAYLGARRRRALLLFYAALGLSALAKDVIGVLGPLAVVAVFFHLTGEPAPWRRWTPWAAIALLLAITLPWYGIVAWRQRDFLWYTFVDNHVLSVARWRVFPDEDVPLTAMQFIGVTAAGFFPWVIALPQALWRGLSRVPGDARERLWLLLALWVVSVLGLFTFAPFRLPHYALPAFPAMALLVARSFNEAFENAAGAPSTRAVLLPPMVLLALLATVSGLAAGGVLHLPAEVLTLGDVGARNVNTQVGVPPATFLDRTRPLLGMTAVIFALAAGVALAAWRRHAMIGVGAMLAGMMAFLPVSGEGLTMFARSRSTAAMAEMTAARAEPGDVLAREGPIEDSASWLLRLEAPVKVVDGRLSSLAFGSTLASSRGLVWGRQDLAQAWRGERRVFLLPVVRAERSVVNDLPPASVHLLLDAGGQRLYSNRP